MNSDLTTAPATPGEDVREVALELIDVPAGRRELDPNWVEALADEFKASIQRTPIDLLQTGERFQLVTGGHRLAAKTLAGHSSIRAVVWQPQDFAHQAQVRLVEIAENFMRRELSVLDRAKDVAAWREVFETMQGAVGRGGDRRSKSKSQVATLMDDGAMDEASARFSGNFTLAAQKALGLSRDAIFRSLKIARISESVRSQIALLPIANNQSELLSLSGEVLARQAAIAEKLVAGAVSIADAIAMIDSLPPRLAPAAWEKMSERFARLKADEQAQFFRLHEDAILQWLAGRKA